MLISRDRTGFPYTVTATIDCRRNCLFSSEICFREEPIVVYNHSTSGGCVIGVSTSAGIAQLVEQLICNQQVVGSNPTAGSPIKTRGYWFGRLIDVRPLRRPIRQAKSNQQCNFCPDLSGDRIDCLVHSSSCALHDLVRDILGFLHAALCHVHGRSNRSSLSAANGDREG